MSARDLGVLYPFLQEKRRDGQALDGALLESVAAKARESRQTNAQFFKEQASVLLAAARAIASSYEGGGRLFAMGNGGSSCDAAHIAVEFQHPITAGRPALPAVNLAAEIAMLSAVGNDVGFEQVFARQIEAHARRGDVLAGFSTSGNSPNILAGFGAAKRIGLVTVGFSGGEGGRMRSSGVVDHCLVAPTGSVHRIQECHVAAYHILWDLVHTLMADGRGSAGGRLQP
ncbi:MAG TPA: SIS domain-containing protein [Rhizomicrobium sp.]